MSWHLFNEPPAPGTRFVALFGDGSGAGVYCYDDAKHLIDAMGDDVFKRPVNGVVVSDWLFDAGYLHWATLPEGQRLFFEEAGE